MLQTTTTIRRILTDMHRFRYKQTKLKRIATELAVGCRCSIKKTNKNNMKIHIYVNTYAKHII